MGLLDRLGRVIRANLNSLISQAEDPEKILEQTVLDMQDDLIQLRQAVAHAIATQKRTERQCAQARTNAEEWYRRAQLGLQKGDELLAREALSRRQTFLQTAQAMQAQIDQQRSIVDQMKSNMRSLEAKLAEAKTKKDMYIARARSAQAARRLNEMLSTGDPRNSTAAFERMEQRVLDLEAQAEAIAELSSGNALDQRFQALESNSNVDAELAALKAQLAGTPSPTLPSSQPPLTDAAIDADLEALRARLEEAG
ncbi:MAG: PspA/IM30 family protein [Elainella sp. Prado103]|nr:PspA/IM30 family protein [Elainella sp. Prado103]